MISRNVTIINRLGLHARAATRLVNCASDFDSEIIVKKGPLGQRKIHHGRADPGCGHRHRTHHRGRGSDEKQALDAVIKLISNRFGEDE